MRAQLSLLFMLLIIFCATSCATNSTTPAPQAAPDAVDTAQAIAELNAMPAPAGVDAALWDGLKRELASALEETPPRQTFAPPTDTDSRSVIVWDRETAGLTWGYFCTGDYDQNGEVGAADLVPLAVHFGKAGDFGLGSVESVVDGDGNGEIGIADITPIATNFGATVEGYNIYAGDGLADYPGGASSVSAAGKAASAATLLDTVALSAAAGDPFASRLLFEYTVADPQEGAVYWASPASGGSDGTPSTAGGAVPGPEAVLTVDPEDAWGDAPLNITLDASGSTSPNGAIIDYIWDFNGDGKFNDPDNGESLARGNPQPVHEYTQWGSYAAMVLVLDEDYLSATASTAVIIAMEPNGLQALLADTGDKMYTAGADVNGRPAIAYVPIEGADADKLMFVRALDEYGMDWGAPAEVGATAGWQRCLSLAEAGGRPCLAWGAETGPGVYEVRFSRADDADGTGWGAPVVALPGWGEDRIALLEADGYPALATCDTDGMGNYNQVFVRAQDAMGSAWGAPVVVDSGAGPLTDTALAIVNGNPAMVYGYTDYNEIPFVGNAYYCWASAADGSAWGTPVTLYAERIVGAQLVDLDDGPLATVHTLPDGVSVPVGWLCESADRDGAAWDVFTAMDSLGKQASAWWGKESDFKCVDTYAGTAVSTTSTGKYVYMVDMMKSDGLNKFLRVGIRYPDGSYSTMRISGIYGDMNVKPTFIGVQDEEETDGEGNTTRRKWLVVTARWENDEGSTVETYRVLLEMTETSPAEESWTNPYDDPDAGEEDS